MSSANPTPTLAALRRHPMAVVIRCWDEEGVIYHYFEWFKTPSNMQDWVDNYLTDFMRVEAKQKSLNFMAIEVTDTSTDIPTRGRIIVASGQKNGSLRDNAKQAYEDALASDGDGWWWVPGRGKKPVADSKVTKAKPKSSAARQIKVHDLANDPSEFLKSLSTQDKAAALKRRLQRRASGSKPKVHSNPDTPVATNAKPRTPKRASQKVAVPA